MTGNNNIPKHWQKTSLGKILTISSGNGLTKSKRNDEGEYLVYGGNGVTGKHSEFLFEEEKLIIGRVGVHCGNAYITKPKSWVTDNAFVVSFDETEINKDFLLNLIGVLNLNKYSVSTAQPVISQGKLYPIEVAIPPLLEQQAIVAKIEQLLSELENGKQQLQTAQQQLKVYRQSLLKWAFEGKLTNKKVKDGELPKGWKIVALDEVSEMCLGKMLDKKKNKGNYQPYLRNISVRWGYFDLSDLEEMRFEESEEERYSLKKDDLVICEGGEPGRCAIWQEENSVMKIQKALHRMRVEKNKLHVKYLYYFIYFSGQSGLLSKYFTGTTIKHLTGRELKKIKIPLPPISVQNIIVQEIESKLTFCDKIVETITNSLQQSESLRQSILKKAFEGKLFNYESSITNYEKEKNGK